MSWRQYKFFVLFSLYWAQTLPIAFFTVAFPLLMREGGVGLEYIGLLNILTIPWAIKFLWSPYVDRYGSRRWGHYTSWIIPFQLGSIACVLWMAQLDFVGDFFVILGIAAAFTTLAATQDIGCDALAVHALSPEERPKGNSFSLIGSQIGAFLGGGAMVMLFDYTGWSVSLYILAAVMVLPIIMLLGYREPDNDVAEGASRPSLASLWEIFRRPGMIAWLLLLNAFGFGSQLVSTMTRPLLIDLGIGLQAAGLVTGVIDPLAGMAGLAAAPLIIARMSRKKAFVLLGALSCAGLALYIPVAMGLFPLAGILFVYAAESFATALVAVLVYSVFMDKSGARTAGTDFTVQNGVFVLGRVLPRVLSGYLAAQWGYTLMFTFGVASYAVGILLVALYIDKANIEPAELPVLPAPTQV